MRLENHLRQPVRVHNMGKRRQELVKHEARDSLSFSRISNNDNQVEMSAKHVNQGNASDAFSSIETLEENNSAIMERLTQEIASSCLVSTEKRSINELQKSKTSRNRKEKLLPHLHHLYAEGIDQTLADMILFPCIHHALVILSKYNHLLKPNLPMVLEWYERMTQDLNIKEIACEMRFPFSVNLTELVMSKASLYNVSLVTRPCGDFLEPQIVTESLYIRDPQRNHSQSKNCFKQEDIERIINQLELSGVNVQYEKHPCHSVRLDWSALPEVVHPSFGELPSSRVLRKCQQVENLVTVVLNIAKPGDTIVDFCSGGGHLGIVIAYLLPHCQVIMIDNKEESLTRAYRRVQMLDLTNAILYQTNLDYFKGKFTIGSSLHACGVASDLVIQHCQKQNAAVVSCPCCYGAVKNTHLISYPQSKTFRDFKISCKDYYILGHAADQTHLNDPKTEQGQLCMGFIDTDRLNYLAEKGYSTLLCALDPPSCSPKNNLLIALPSMKENPQPFEIKNFFYLK